MATYTVYDQREAPQAGLLRDASRPYVVVMEYETHSYKTGTSKRRAVMGHYETRKQATARRRYLQNTRG